MRLHIIGVSVSETNPEISTATASSTTKPTHKVSAISEMLSRLYPNRYISENVPMIDIGSATVGMTVAGMFRRNMKITITTRASARIRENCTSSTDWRMVVDRSYITLMLIPAGTSTRNVGSSFLTASTTSMVLVPGCR